MFCSVYDIAANDICASVYWVTEYKYDCPSIFTLQTSRLHWTWLYVNSFFSSR